MCRQVRRHYTYEPRYKITVMVHLRQPNYRVDCRATRQDNIPGESCRAQMRKTKSGVMSKASCATIENDIRYVKRLLGLRNTRW